jgi:hypothetical protein
MLAIDTIRVECDERGFELHITDDYGDEHRFNMQAVAEELWDEMVKKVGPWVLEKAAARRDYERTKDAEQDDGPWPGESPLDYFHRTGDDGPLRLMADFYRARAKVGE